MKWKDPKAREYYSKYEKVEVNNHQDWFDVYRLPGEVYAICEAQHFQEVNAYLIIGKERALLFDTGMGICNIKPLIQELYPGEIVVVNSHFHFDHVGDNWRFEKVYIYNDFYAKKAAKKGMTVKDVGDQMVEDLFLFGYPEGFNPKEYNIPPYKAITIEDGHVFDLGKRTLKVYNTPGHSNDAIMLHDEQEHILFTGDSFYLGALYAHFHNDQFGHSNIHDYQKSMEKMAELPEVKTLYVSHNDFEVEPVKLKEAAEALTTIIKGMAHGNAGIDQGHTYLEGGRQLVQYTFDGFSIIFDGIKSS